MATKTNNIFGEKLKELLSRNEMTQKALADAAKVSGAMITDWVQGNNMPTGENLQRVSRVFKRPEDIELARAWVSDQIGPRFAGELWRSGDHLPRLVMLEEKHAKAVQGLIDLMIEKKAVREAVFNLAQALGAVDS